MIRSLIVCLCAIIVWIPEISAQQYFSRSLDLAKSGNNIAQIVTNEEKVLISYLVNCPFEGPLTSCGGFHIYNYHKDSFSDDFFLSQYPDHLFPCLNPIEFGKNDEILYCVLDVVHSLDLTPTIVSVSPMGDFQETFRFQSCPATTCFPKGIVALEGDGYLMFGHQRDTTKVQNGGSFFLLKLDENLNVVWYSYYELSVWQVISNNAITILNNGNIALTGYVGGGTNRILAIVVTDRHGNELWRRIINTDPGRTYSSGLPFVSPLGEDQILVSWVYFKPHFPDMGIYNGYYPYFYIFDQEGNEVKTILLDQAVDLRNVTRVKPTSDGGIIGVGDFNERPRLTDEVQYRGYMFRLDNSGDLMWEKTYWDVSHVPEDRPHAFNYFMDVAELPDGRIVAGGGRADTVGPGVLNSNGWLVMLDEHGECPSEEGCEHLEVRDLTITNTRDIKEVTELPAIEVFPNPASHEVYVRIPEFTTGTIQVYDLRGKMVQFEKSVLHQAQIDVSGWPKGMYIVLFKSSDGSMLLKGKLVVIGE